MKPRFLKTKLSFTETKTSIKVSESKKRRISAYGEKSSQAWRRIMERGSYRSLRSLRELEGVKGSYRLPRQAEELEADTLVDSLVIGSQSQSYRPLTP